MVYQENKQQGDKVEHSKDVLGHWDVSALASRIVQPHKDVHKTSGVAGGEREHEPRPGQSS